MTQKIFKKLKTFSLIELLVVVAIIAVMLSLLQPALSSALSQARTTLCINNNRQLVTAIRLYTDDYNTFMPFSSWDSLAGFRATPRNSWAYMYPYKKYIEQGLKQSQIYPYVNKVEIWRCPEDEGSPNGGYQIANKVTSYLMNGAVNGYGRKWGQYRIGEFNAADMMLFEISENADRGLWNDAASYPSEIYDSLPIRHQLRGVTAHFDGHVEAMATEEYMELLNHYPGPLWCNPGHPTGRR